MKLNYIKNGIIGLLFIFFISIRAVCADIYIPSQLTMMETSIQINQAGKDRILKKYNSLKKSNVHYDQLLELCLQYFPVVERELKEAGVPDDFKYLMMQESSFKGDAVSRSNAVGFWQFKQATAEEYQLQINSKVDERKNIVSSTRAAAAYLKKSHHYLNSWMYALLSYHDGLGGVRREWSGNSYFSKNVMVVDANSHYYPVHFLAHYFAFKEAYLEAKAKKKSEIYLLEYSVDLIDNIQDLASYIAENTTLDNPQLIYKDIMKYNPWVLGETIPVWQGNQKFCYSLVIPIFQAQKAYFINKLKDFACNEKVRSASDYFYKDSIQQAYPFVVELHKKGRLYNHVLINGIKGIKINKEIVAGRLLKKIRKEDLLVINHLDSKEKLLPGNILYLEEKNDIVYEAYHIVLNELETLKSISNKYGIKMEKLLAYNEIKEGEKLVKGDFIWFNPKK